MLLDPPRCLASTPDRAVGTCQNLTVVVWRSPPTVPSIEQLKRELAGVLKENRKDGIFLTVLENMSSPPSGPARQAIAGLMQSGAGVIRASAMVFEGQGFRAAAIRSVAVGMSVIAHQPLPHKIFGSMDEAARWLASQSPSGLQVEQIVSTVAQIRSWKAG